VASSTTVVPSGPVVQTQPGRPQHGLQPGQSFPGGGCGGFEHVGQRRGRDRSVCGGEERTGPSHQVLVRRRFGSVTAAVDQQVGSVDGEDVGELAE
jgi:hypothetical protein